MKLIVGLGNPGEQYAPTRHNVGFIAIDELSKRWSIPASASKWKGITGDGLVNGEKVVLLKPQTYMNLSGESVRDAVDWLKIDIQDVLIIYDDLDLPVGQIRLREKGSAGGQNGMKSIIHHLGTQEFKRLRIGIDRPAPGRDISSYVLSAFDKDEKEKINEAMERMTGAVETWLSEGFVQAMSKYPK